MTDFSFIPAVNGDAEKQCKVKEFHYPEEYRRVKDNQAPKFDFGIMILEEDLAEDYGYFGIDTR